MTDRFPTARSAQWGIAELEPADYVHHAHYVLGLEPMSPELRAYFEAAAKRHRDAVARQRADNLKHYGTKESAGRMALGKVRRQEENLRIARILEGMASDIPAAKSELAGLLEVVGLEAESVRRAEEILREERAGRDRAILEASKAGGSDRAIAKAAGVSYAYVQKVRRGDVGPLREG